MKYTGLLLSLSIASITTGAFASSGCYEDDYIVGSCSFTLSGNDVDSHWGADKDDRIEDLEESTVVEEMKVCALSTPAIRHEYIRIIPYADSVESLADYQIAAFKNDTSATTMLVGNDYVETMKATTNFAVGYGSKKESVNNSLSDPFRVVGKNSKWPQVTIQLRTQDHKFVGGKTKKKVRINGKQTVLRSTSGRIKIPLKKTGETTISIKEKVSFEYHAIPGDGFLGLFKGDVTKKDAEEAGNKIHDAELSIKCSFSMPEKEEAIVEENPVSFEEETTEELYESPYKSKLKSSSAVIN
jgi:hypothetical protein